MLGICNEKHNADSLIIPALRALACVLTLARFHVHTSETLSLLKYHINQFGHCGNLRALPAVRISTIVCELGFLLLMDQYAFSLKNKYMRISTTDTYCRYWRDLIVNG